jgi:hypothetical protein
MTYELIKGLIAPKELTVLREYCNRWLQLDSFPDLIVPYFEGSGAGRRLVRIERLMEHLEVDTGIRLLELCTELVHKKTGQDALLFKDKINFRYPGAAGFGAHQDAAAGWTDYSPIFHSVAFFLYDTDAAHGGFEFSVDDPLGAFYPNASGQISKDLFESFQRCDVEACAGDAIFFDSFAPHRSYTNESDAVLPHIILTFNPAIHGDQRSVYYENKLVGMGGGNGSYDFRLFDFGNTDANKM